MITYSRMYHHYSSYTFCISQVQVQKFLSKCFIKKKKEKRKIINILNRRFVKMQVIKKSHVLPVIWARCCRHHTNRGYRPNWD